MTKPRKKYRPKKTLVVPMCWGMTAQMERGLAIKDRNIVDAIISGDGASAHVEELRRMAVTMFNFARMAAEDPTAHTVYPEGVKAALARLSGPVAEAVHDIAARLESTGRVGVNGAERQALLELADLCDELRRNLPRRLYMKALEYTILHPEMRGTV